MGQRAKGGKTDRKRRKRGKEPVVPARASTCEKIQLDAFDVRHRFAANPLQCVSTPRDRLVLRDLEFPYRYWHKTPAEAQDRSKFWDDLSRYLEKEFGEKNIAHRFADLLVGYLLVTENTTPGRALRQLRPLVGSAPTSRPQHRESLQLVLTRAMADDLTRVWKKRKIACEVFIPQIWSAIGIRVEPSSILRTERRSRRRTQGTN